METCASANVPLHSLSLQLDVWNNHITVQGFGTTGILNPSFSLYGVIESPYGNMAPTGVTNDCSHTNCVIQMQLRYCSHDVPDFLGYPGRKTVVEASVTNNIQVRLVLWYSIPITPKFEWYCHFDFLLKFIFHFFNLFKL